MKLLKRTLFVFIFLLIAIIGAFLIYRTYQKPKYEGDLFLKNIAKEKGIKKEFSPHNMKAICF